MEASDEQEEQSAMLPELTVNETLGCKELQLNQHFTRPPPRYTEAMLVKALEEKGIGRPSTFAPTIDTILKRGYVVLRIKVRADRIGQNRCGHSQREFHRTDRR